LQWRSSIPPEWEELSRNHLEGRTAGFFCYGDGGAAELDASGRPRILHHSSYFDPQAEPFADNRDGFAPLVWQCRYSGIEVPDALWRYVEFGRGKTYSDNQAEDMVREVEVMAAFDQWADDFAHFVEAKGKVEPGPYRAYGYQPPRHRWADLKLKWRELRLRLGFPPPGSSPAKQQALGLNRNTVLNPRKGEGERIRK
jgi:hypothetical protein